MYANQHGVFSILISNFKLVVFLIRSLLSLFKKGRNILFVCFFFSCVLIVLKPSNRKIMSALSSPEKEDRYYTTRGSTGGGFDESSSSKKVLQVDAKKETKKVVWPKLFTTLSSKEKEEDFMLMKGCKLPQRPKKRAKTIQRTLLVKLLDYPFHFVLESFQLMGSLFIHDLVCTID